MRDMLSPWDRYRGRVEEYRELEAERVLVLTHASGRGKVSGLELDALSTQQAQVVHVRDGKVTKILVYYDRERTIADLGLSEVSDVAGERWRLCRRSARFRSAKANPLLTTGTSWMTGSGARWA